MLCSQFYPSCLQAELKSSGTTKPEDDLVAFPGAYSADDGKISPGQIVRRELMSTSAAMTINLWDPPFTSESVFPEREYL